MEEVSLNGAEAAKGINDKGWEGHILLKDMPDDVLPGCDAANGAVAFGCPVEFWFFVDLEM